MPLMATTCANMTEYAYSREYDLRHNDEKLVD